METTFLRSLDGPSMLVRAAALLAVAALLLLGVGCTTPKTSDQDLTFITALDADQAVRETRRRGLLRGEQRAVCVDPRGKTAFETEHIAGAVSVPFQKVTDEYERLKKAYDIVIVYGKTYDDPVAIGMSKRLIELGLKDVRTLEGGLRAWLEAGLPVESGPAAAEMQTDADG